MPGIFKKQDEDLQNHHEEFAVLHQALQKHRQIMEILTASLPVHDATFERTHLTQ